MGCSSTGFLKRRRRATQDRTSIDNDCFEKTKSKLTGLVYRAKTPRPGYMGHMTLIAEEVVKLFQRQPTAIYNIVEKRLPQPAWYEYVTTTLKDIRERESVQLGGAPAHVDRDLPSAPSVLEDDDEFPMNSSRSMRAQEKDRSAGPVSGQADPLNGAGGIESADDKVSLTF